MCGIAGIFETQSEADVDRDLLISMNNSLLHRGPDEGGVHCEPGVGLAHRRLAIIDLSSGQQPLFNEDQTVVVVFNGEIYNFQELAKELAALGHHFRTHSDTEVIVHAWEQWGDDCVRRFRGMFAFVLWDRNRRTLFLARDRLGKKPLYYTLTARGQLLFASELKALLVHPDVKRDLDPQAIEDYFGFGYVPDPKTIFRAVRKLPPAHMLTVVRGETVGQSRAYWDASFEPQGGARDVRAVEEELVHRLREAVKIRLVSEVPLGAFLSGGVDSSAVVAMMAGLSREPVNTCSISFGDPRFDEAQYAQRVADLYRTKHFVETVDTDDFDLIDHLARIYDEPFADSSAMPTYRVCGLARKRVTVALSGDGGDETFAGYRRYRWHLREERLRNVLPLGLRRPVFGTLGRFYPKLDWAPQFLRAKTTFQELARDTVEGYFNIVSVISDPMRDRLYSDKFKNDLQGYQAAEVLREHIQRAPTDHPISQAQYLDMKTYLPGDILVKVDRASMAHSLEVRAPILDHELIDWAGGLTADWKYRGGEGKYLLKSALRPYLPHDILYRKKMGFAVPLAAWFRGPLRERLRTAILGDGLRQTGLFNSRRLKHLVDEHQSGRRDYSSALWSLLMFESFHRQVMMGHSLQSNRAQRIT